MNGRAILEKLVAFDTTSSRSNLDLISWVADYLAHHGCASRLTHDDSANKANLLTTIGPEVEGGVLLSGHTDVVPVAGQVWRTNPYVVTEGDDRLYGRGTADMKGFIACCLAKVPTWSALPLARPIHLALSFDEEVGCLGVHRLISDLQQNVPRPGFAIIGEPTEMRAVVAHKGVYVFRTRITGRGAHSSDPDSGLSAIEYAVRFIQSLFDLAAEQRGITSAFTKLQPPFTTFNMGLIQGGAAMNMVPPACTLTWEFRPIPEADIPSIRTTIDTAATRLRAEMKQAWPAADIRIEELATVPPLRLEGDNPALDFLRQLSVQDAASPAVAFGTEAGLFQAAGIPSVVCGPGSITQAHQADEWVALDQLRLAGQFLGRLGEWASATA